MHPLPTFQDVNQEGSWRTVHIQSFSSYLCTNGEYSDLQPRLYFKVPTCQDDWARVTLPPPHRTYFMPVQARPLRRQKDLANYTLCLPTTIMPYIQVCPKLAIPTRLFYIRYPITTFGHVLAAGIMLCCVLRVLLARKQVPELHIHSLHLPNFLQ